MLDRATVPATDECIHPLAPRLLAMRVELLVTFAVLAKELHFTRAARTLHLSQSGLSRRVAALERCLGVALLDRTTRTVALTPAGHQLLPHALAVLEGIRAATAALARPPAVPAQRQSSIPSAIA